MGTPSETPMGDVIVLTFGNGTVPCPGVGSDSDDGGPIRRRRGFPGVGSEQVPGGLHNPVLPSRPQASFRHSLFGPSRFSSSGTETLRKVSDRDLSSDIRKNEGEMSDSPSPGFVNTRNGFQQVRVECRLLPDLGSGG